MTRTGVEHDLITRAGEVEPSFDRLKSGLIINNRISPSKPQEIEV